MHTRTPASIMLAVLFGLTACNGEKAPADAAPASTYPSVTAAAPDSAELAEQVTLAKEVKVLEADARVTALKEIPGATFDKVELERENGKLIYSYDLKIPGKEGIEEVAIDALTGAVVNKEHEADPKPEPNKKATGGGL